MTGRNDGGPAYPRSGVKDGYGRVVGDTRGMSLRDYIAAKQAAKIFAEQMAQGDVVPQEAADVAAIWSYVIADAMIAARDKA